LSLIGGRWENWYWIKGAFKKWGWEVPFGSKAKEGHSKKGGGIRPGPFKEAMIKIGMDLPKIILRL